MNTRCIGLTVVLLAPGAAQALEWDQDWSDWEVRPRISTGVMQYEYQQQAKVNVNLEEAESVGAGFDEIEVGDSLLFAEIGVSVFLGNFFVDLSLQKTDEGEDDVSQRAFSGATINADESVAFFGLDLDSQRTMDREDFSLSIGYALTDNFGVFAGYKRNNTQFDDDIRSGRAILAVAAVGESGGGTLVTDVTGSSSSEFEQDGLFFGATYVLPFESEGWLNGALSFDLGVAFLSGDLAIKEQTTVSSEDLDISEASVSSQNAKGDAVGINLGVAWSGPLTDKLSYAVGVDGYQYDYEGDSGSSDFQDTLLRFSVGVSYAIDAKGVF